MVYRGKPMRVAGRMLLEGASGQSTFRYLISDGAGAPVLLEQAAGSRFALLRPLPPAADPDTSGKTVTVGEKIEMVCGKAKVVLEKAGKITWEIDQGAKIVLDDKNVLIQAGDGGTVVVIGGPDVHVNP